MPKNGDARIIAGCLYGEGCEVPKPLRPEAKERSLMAILKKKKGAHLHEEFRGFLTEGSDKTDLKASSYGSLFWAGPNTERPHSPDRVGCGTTSKTDLNYIEQR
jgi:hypothetical protein